MEKTHIEHLSAEQRKERRRQKQHERYVRKREEILAKQKTYREANKEKIRERRRQRHFERIYIKNKRPKLTQKERNHIWYLAHRQEKIERTIRNYERRKQRITTDSKSRATDVE